jgi:hypothetical protein
VNSDNKIDALGNGLLNEKVIHVKFVNQNFSNSTVVPENISLEGREIAYNIKSKKNSSKSTLDNLLLINQQLP